MKLLKYIHTVLCYFPWLFIIAFYSFVLRAMLKLGHAPTYGYADPKSLGFNMHHSLVYILLFIVLSEFLYGLLFIMWSWKKGRLYKINALVFLAGIIAIIAMFTFDRGNIGWFAD